MTVNDVIAGFCSALYFPHPKVKTIWREHRLVVLPLIAGLDTLPALRDIIHSLLFARYIIKATFEVVDLYRFF